MDLLFAGIHTMTTAGAKGQGELLFQTCVDSCCLWGAAWCLPRSLWQGRVIPWGYCGSRPYLPLCYGAGRFSWSSHTPSSTCFLSTGDLAELNRIHIRLNGRCGQLKSLAFIIKQLACFIFLPACKVLLKCPWLPQSESDLFNYVVHTSLQGLHVLAQKCRKTGWDSLLLDMERNNKNILKGQDLKQIQRLGHWHC